MNGSRDIKRRIKSVGNIKQITHAMQLVAASKMRQAQMRANDADAYAYGSLEILENLTAAMKGMTSHKFWSAPDAQKVGIILCTTDRGFCGGLNVNLLLAFLQFIKHMKAQGKDIEVITVGKKGRDFSRTAGLTIRADFSGKGDRELTQESAGIAHLTMSSFKSGDFHKFYLGFTQFINTVSQKPVIRQLVPLETAVFKEIAEIDVKHPRFYMKKKEQEGRISYLFEPTEERVFEKLVPHLIEIVLYKALLESRASEHSARMIAMKNATEKAGELSGDLRLAYNQARQAAITKEIAEISTAISAMSH